MPQHPQLGTPIAVYPYRRLSGDVAFVVCRFDPKDFRPAQQRGGRWVWNLHDAPVLPYRLPELDQALADSQTIWIVDGEKDADALAAAGAAATCCARSQGWTIDLAEQLTGARHIRIVADRDNGTGLRQALEVRDLLVRAGAVASCDIDIVQAAAGKDAADHLDAGLELTDFEHADSDSSLAGGQAETDSWTPVNLNALPDKPPVEPDLGQTRLIYPGKRHVFSGPPESAKTLAAYAILVQVVREGGTAVLIDFEMGPYDARQRLRELGAAPDELSRILYLEPDERATPERISQLVAHRPDLVVIDAAAGAYTLEGLDDNKRGEVERFTNLYIGVFWRNGIATILLDHVVKDAEHRGRFQIGSERKLGATDVHIGFDTVKPVSRGSTGRYKLVVHKDRGGYHKRGHLADLRLDSDPATHQISWSFTEPEPTTGDTGYFRPTHLMEKVSINLELRSEPATRNMVYEAVGGTKDYILKAITALVLEGFVTETSGPNRSKLLTSQRRYREADDTTQSDQSDPGGSVVRTWFDSGSTNHPVSGGSVVRPPYGDDTTRPPAPDHPEHAGWFDSQGTLTDAWYDQIAPDPNDNLFGGA